MTTFTMYRLDMLNLFDTQDEPVYDTTYYLESDVNYNDKSDYKLPEGWRFVDAGDDDFNSLITDSGDVIDGRNISHDKTKNRPFARYLKDGGTARHYFDEVTND